MTLGRIITLSRPCLIFIVPIPFLVIANFFMFFKLFSTDYSANIKRHNTNDASVGKNDIVQEPFESAVCAVLERYRYCILQLTVSAQ